MLAPDFDITLAAVSFFLVVIALGVAAVLWLDARSCRRSRGSPSATGAQAGHVFLVNKYYLDHLYEGTIVAGDQGPDRPGLVLGQPERHRRRRERAGSGRDGARRLVYRYVDQDVVDGAVNGIASETGQAGGLLRYVQSGRVQRYALILFASVGVTRPRCS